MRGTAGLGLRNGGVLAADAVWDVVLRLPLGLRLENVHGPLFTPRLVSKSEIWPISEFRSPTKQGLKIGAPRSDFGWTYEGRTLVQLQLPAVVMCHFVSDRKIDIRWICDKV